MHKLKHKYTHTMILHDEKWLKINSMSFFLLLFIPQHHPAAHQAKEATWNTKKGGKFFNLLIFQKKQQKNKLNSFQWKSKHWKRKRNIIIEMTHITHIKLNSQRKDTMMMKKKE